MNWVPGVVKRALQRHGANLKYTTTVVVVNENEGTVTQTPTDFTLRIYPRPIQTNQYNFPTLVGKQVVMFYLAAEDLTFDVKPSDTIEYLGDVYRINSFQPHVAHGITVLYKLIGVKG